MRYKIPLSLFTLVISYFATAAALPNLEDRAYQDFYQRDTNNYYYRPAYPAGGYNSYNGYNNSGGYNYSYPYNPYYGSPPPPLPSQSFPDDAAADALYRHLQNR